MSRPSRITVEAGQALPAVMYAIESPGSEDGLAPLGSAGGIPLLLGYANSEGTPIYAPPMQPATVDEARVTGSGDGCNTWSSYRHGRDDGANILDVTKRIQVISHLTRFRFPLPLLTKTDHNPKSAIPQLIERTLPSAPIGFTQLSKQNGDYTAKEVAIWGLFGGEQAIRQGLFVWNLPGDYTITTDAVFRGRAADILQQLGEPFSHCEATRPIILSFTNTDDHKPRVYYGPIEGAPSQSYAMDYADAKITHWEFRRYRGPRYGLVTILGGIDPTTLKDFDDGEQTSVDFSYDGHGHAIQQIITTIFHRPSDNAIVKQIRSIYGPKEPDAEGLGGFTSPTTPSGSIGDTQLNIRLMNVETTIFIWEPAIVEGQSGQIVNRPVLLAQFKTTNDDHGDEVSSEIIANSYDEYKRLAASMTVTTTTDPDTDEITYAQTETKTYPRARLNIDYARFASGDIEALSNVPGGAGSGSARGQRFILQQLIDEGPGAVDVTIDNIWLGGQASGDPNDLPSGRVMPANQMSPILQEFARTSGQEKQQFVFQSDAMPWLKRGDLLTISNIVDDKGVPFPFMWGYVVDVHQLFDQSKPDAEASQEITLQRWV